MDAKHYNGAQEQGPGRSNGKPEPYHCRVCGWTGKGSIARADHWRATGHPTAYGKVPDALCFAERKAG